MFQYAFMQNALIASIFIACLSPCIGLFLVLRRHSMIGDALSHSALGGVTLGMLLGVRPIISAFIFTGISSLAIEYLRSSFKRYTELILNIVMALGVGIAITLISSGRLSANADGFLFGSILTVGRQDLFFVIALTLISFVTLIILFDRLTLITFDEESARVLGINVALVNYIFMFLVAAVISMMIRIVGVMVVSSLLTLPVATSMQFRAGLKQTLALAIGFSLVQMVGGLVLSYHANVAPGGFIVLLSVFVLLFVILLRFLGSRVRNLRIKDTTDN
ncbi:MAG: metal ABC transporter permease [Fastidiosipilaceae bacterium]|jgi:zinc transport system permease protein